MNKEHQKILQNNRKFLVDNLTANAIEGICDVLLQEGILTPGLADAILKKTPIPYAQARELLTTLTKRGPKAYATFIEALDQTVNEFIVEKLTACEEKPSNDKPPVPPVCNHIPDWPKLSKACSIDDGKHIKKTTKEIYRQILEKHNPDKIYPMTKNTKGKVIYLYNTLKPPEVDTQTDCCLSSFDWDKTIIESVFKCTGYDKKIAVNKSGEEMKTFLREQILPKEHESYDSLILVICSSGINFEPSKIYDKSGKEVPLDEILDIIKPSIAFKNKPKVVILQTYIFKELKTPRDELDSKLEKLKLNSENAEDLFVVTSYPARGYGPWMMGDKLKGSYFIQALAHVLKHHSHTMSFVEIVEEVKRCLLNAVVPEFKNGKETSITTKNAVAEVAFVTKCSQKEFFIFPGLDLNTEMSSK